MNKYIKLIDSDGNKVEKPYSDSALIALLHTYDTGQKEMAIFDEQSPQDAIRRNFYVKFYNPDSDNAENVVVGICDIRANKGSVSCRKFVLELEKLLKKEFPDKHLFSQKEQILKIMKAVNIAPKVDYRKEKIFSNYINNEENLDMVYNDDSFLAHLEKDIRLLENVNKIKIMTEYGGYLEGYDDYSYAVTVQIKSQNIDDDCSISIFEWLKNLDGSAKIKSFMKHLSNIIAEKYPRITLLVDYDLKN